MPVLTRLQEILAKDYKVATANLEPQTHLSALGIDSLGMLELMFKIEDNFHVKIPGDPPTDMVTVHDVCTYVEGLVADQQSFAGASRGPGMQP